MTSRFITYQSSRIHYAVFGQGPRLLFCFHGYGESSAGFGFLAEYIGDAFTLVCPDLPFHQPTDWQEGPDFRPEDLLKMVQLLAAEPGLPSPAGISVLGYSMGGRMALQLTRLIPEKIEQLLLLAPDGLKKNFWYRLATQSYLGSRLFRYTMHNPGWFKSMLGLVKKLGLTNASILKFVHHYIDDPVVRRQLYTRWTGFRHIGPSLPQLKMRITEYAIPVDIVYGRHDRIILPSPGRRFQKGIEALCRIHLLDCGHRILQEKNGAKIAGLMQPK